MDEIERISSINQEIYNMSGCHKLCHSREDIKHLHLKANVLWSLHEHPRKLKELNLHRQH